MREKFLFIIFGVFIQYSVFVSAQENKTFDKETIVKDVSYRQGGVADFSDCKVDIAFYPDKKDLPVIIWFHGGGLTGGHRDMPAALTNQGYVVVDVEYRLMPKVHTVDCIDDAAAAIAWTFKNIEKYGGSPKKIYTSGHSAGGYLVMMTGLNKEYLAKYGIDADNIKAIVPYSGQAISHFNYRKYDKGMENPLRTPIIDDFSPIYHVRGDAPPMLIITGDRELEMYGRYEENAYLVRMLKLNGHKEVIFYEEQGYNHGDMALPAHLIFLKYIREREK